MNEFSDYRILITEDDKEIRKMLEEMLRREGFNNICASEDGAGAVKVVKSLNVALCLLDVMLPDCDGFSLYGDIRRYSDCPVIFITARGEAADRIKGLGLGADDYIVKPFLGRELMLRVTAVLRRTYGRADTDTVIELEDRRISFGSASVIGSEGEVPLTAKEFVLLKKLYENKNRIVTNDALCMAAWGDGYYGYENTLMVHIRHLREKIEKNPSSPCHLITVKGLGYKLVIKREG